LIKAYCLILRNFERVRVRKRNLLKNKVLDTNFS
jgi:hypothetical protein